MNTRDRDIASQKIPQMLADEVLAAATGLPKAPSQDLREVLARQARQLDALLQVGQALSSISNLERLLQMIADESRNLLDAALASIFLVTDDGEGLQLAASSGVSQMLYTRHRIPIEGSYTGIAVRECRPLVCNDLQTEPRFLQRDLATLENLHGLIAVPIIFENMVIGVISIYSQGPPHEPERSLLLLSGLSSQAGAAIASARRMERIIQTENLLRQSERMALIGMMSAELAHEVRNPVTVIQMLMTAIYEDPSLSENIREDLSLILNKLQDIERIVSRTLDLASSQESDIEVILMPEVVEDVLRLLDHRLRENHVRVERDFVAAMPRVSADRAQIQQVLLNLMLNALEALRANDAQEREKLVRITLRETSRDGQPGIEVALRDNGPGLPHEISGRVFEPFVSGKRRGTGLGLYICSRIVSKHLGVLRAQNNSDGPGCTLTFWLPIHHAPKNTSDIFPAFENEE